MATEFHFRVKYPQWINSHVSGSTVSSSGHGRVGGRDEGNGIGKPPVVFLYGSRYKDLAKYSSIYQSRSYITIEYIHNYRERGIKLKAVAVAVLESFFEHGLERNPIFFHLFSDGGGYIYKHVTVTVNGTDPGKFGSLDIRGVILDSLPSRVTPTTVYESLLAMMPPSRPWIVNATVSYLLMNLFRILTVVEKSHQDKLRAYYRAMVEDAMQCPQLFLYSKGDKAVPYTDIQLVMSERRRRGFKVREVLWEDSLHVHHLQKHGEQYASSCLKFVEDCLASSDEKGWRESVSPDQFLVNKKRSKL